MKKSILLCAFVFLGTPLVSAQTAQDNVKTEAVTKIYEYAESSYTKGDYKEAEQSFQKVLQLDPNNTSAADYIKKIGQTADKAANKAADKSEEALRTEKIEHSVETFSSVKTPGPAVSAAVPVPAAVAIAPIAQPADENSDIKDQIAAEDKAIGQVNDAIAQLRAPTESNPHE